MRTITNDNVITGSVLSFNENLFYYVNVILVFSLLSNDLCVTFLTLKPPKNGFRPFNLYLIINGLSMSDEFGIF